MANDTLSVDAFVGMKVRARRVEISMSQERLGDALGVTFQQVQKYEKGSNRISASRLFQIAQVLGVSVSYFFESIEAAQTADSDGGTSASNMLHYLGDRDVVRLLGQFSRIKDDKKRRQVLTAVKLMAS